MNIISLEKLDEYELGSRRNIKKLSITICNGHDYPGIYRFISHYSRKSSSVGPFIFRIHINDTDSSLVHYTLIGEFTMVFLETEVGCILSMSANQDGSLIHGGYPVIYSRMLIDSLESTLYTYVDP